MKYSPNQTIAIDFDGVIHQYSRGWHDGTAYDIAMEGAADAIKRIMEAHPTYILTTRPLDQVEAWMKDYMADIPTALVPADALYWKEQGVLGLSNRKLVTFLWIDDRVLHFKSWAQTLEEMVERGVSL